MHLTTGEKAILAYFHRSSHAQQALSELKLAGFSNVQMDRITRPPVTHEDTRGFHRMSLYEYADELAPEMTSDTARPSHSYVDLDDEHDYVVTIVTEQTSASHALSIVKKYAHIVN